MNNWHIHKYETVNSTMDCARELIEQGITPSSQHVIMARYQTHGRGRFGRKWVSVPGNLLCSFILQPLKEAQYWAELSFVTSLALYNVMVDLLPDIDVKLKWPNDVMVETRKIAGILLETHYLDNQNGWLVVGIGVNIASSPKNTMQPTTYLAKYAPLRYDTDQFLINLIHHFDKLLLLWQLQGFTIIRQQWLMRAANLHQTVTVRASKSDTITGQFVDINEQGCMIIKDEDHKIRIVSAGDVV